MITMLANFIRRFFRAPHLPDFLMIGILWAITIVAAAIALALLAREAHALPLSVGDRLNLTIYDGADFSGKYQINLNGAIELPYAGPVAISGREPGRAEQVIATALVEGGFFKREYLRVSIQLLELAPAEISVEGAVFYPGRHRVNVPPSRDRAPEKSEELPGGKPSERYLSDALRAAGGVQPTADIRNIELARHGEKQLIDLTGMLDGSAVNDVPLISGDVVTVRDTGATDSRLVRPSRITPPGIKVFTSNLTAPANNNNASTVSTGTISLPYGSRLSQAMVAANCTGGTGATNAGRTVVMARTDRLSGRNTTIHASVEDLFNNAGEAANPVLLEGDSIACYDSGVTNLRDIFRTLADILLPFRGISVFAPR